MAWIYHNAELWVISMSSDWVNWLTIADKNLGATQVYDGSVMSEATSGKFYQWWNNHWFPYSDSFTTSSTKVDASTYWPWNYYDGDVFITSWEWDWDWSSVPNDNLRWWVTWTVEAMQWPCSNWFHIPTKAEWVSVIHILAVDFDFEQNGVTLKTYLKLPICGFRRSSDWMIQRTNNYWYYHTVTIATSWKTSYFLMTNPSVASTNEYTYHTTGGSIRPFKNEAEIPYADEWWTKLYWGDLPPRPVPPEPKNYIKRFQNNWNYYYFWEPPVHASGVTLNKSSLTLTEEGQTEQLIATVTPSDAVEKSVTWTSSDTTVAIVYQDWTVECVSPGDCTITCTVNDGGYTATCSVNSRVDVYVDFLLVWWGWGWWWEMNENASSGWWWWAWGYVLCNNIFLTQWDYNIVVWNWWCWQMMTCWCNWCDTSIEVNWNNIVACWWWWGWTRSVNWRTWWSWWWWWANDSYIRSWWSWISWQWYSWWNWIANGWWGWGGPWSAWTTRWACCWWMGWDWKSFTIYWTTYCIWGWWWWWGYCYRWSWSWWWGDWWIWRNSTRPTNWWTYCWAWGWWWWWWGWGCNWAWWVAIIWYPTSCWYTVTWWTCCTCWDYTIHCFTSNWTLCVN